MQSPTVTTAEQLFVLHEPGFRHELVRGELRRMSASGPVHCIVTMRLAMRLAKLVEEHDLGAVFGADTGFVLARNPDTVLAPDIAFVRKARLLTAYPPGFFPGPPDLAVEVVSPGDTFTEVREKAHLWIAHGTRLVWVIDPIARRVTVYHSNADIRTLGVDDMLSGDDLVPGFTVRVRELFTT